MTDQNDWYRLLSLARSHAANDLATSNSILAISDLLISMHEEEGLNKEEIIEISNQLINIALELTDKSKGMNFAVTKLTGVI